MDFALLFALFLLGMFNYASALKCYSCDSRFTGVGCNDATFEAAALTKVNCGGSCRYNAFTKPTGLDYTTRSCNPARQETSCAITGGVRSNNYVETTECHCSTNLCNDVHVAAV